MPMQSHRIAIYRRAGRAWLGAHSSGRRGPPVRPGRRLRHMISVRRRAAKIRLASDTVEFTADCEQSDSKEHQAGWFWRRSGALKVAVFGEYGDASRISIDKGDA